MAKVIGPLHSTEARGVIGGLIYNTWRGIRTVKRMTSPAQPRTLLALSIRAKAITLVRAWQALDDATRALWNAYAEAHPLIDWTGVAKRVTGANWYVGLNTRLLKAGLVKSDIPPLDPAPDSIVSWSVQDQAASIRCIWEGTAGTAISAIFWLFGPHSTGLQGKIERAHWAQVTPGETADIPVPVPAVGFYTIWAYMMDEASGLISVPEVRTIEVTSMT